MRFRAGIAGTVPGDNKADAVGRHDHDRVAGVFEPQRRGRTCSRWAAAQDEVADLPDGHGISLSHLEYDAPACSAGARVHLRVRT
jgi:hypothetical protein